MALHKSFGKILAAFELSTRLAWTDYHHVGNLAVGFEVVVDAGYQRVFVAHHHHIDVVFDNESLHSGEVERRESHIFAIGAGATVAGSDE